MPITVSEFSLVRLLTLMRSECVKCCDHFHVIDKDCEVAAASMGVGARAEVWDEESCPFICSLTHLGILFSFTQEENKGGPDQDR